jgi:hypothetical protein
MRSSILTILCFFGLLASFPLKAQSPVPDNWNMEQIKGTRHVSYPTAHGSPYLNEKYLAGEIELVDGVNIGDLKLRYSCYRDQLIYYNPEISAQIVIDKFSLKGFSLFDSSGIKRTFRQLFYNGFNPGNRFFEILVESKVSLLSYREAILETGPPYMDNLGKLNNVTYQQAFGYFLFDPGRGFEPIRINKNSLLSKFSQTDRKQVNRMLRKNRIKIKDEGSVVMAWKLIEKQNFELICKFNHSEPSR